MYKMQFSNLLQSNGAIAGASGDPVMTPQSGEFLEVSEKLNFQAVMEEGDQLGVGKEPADDGALVLELGGAVSAVIKSVAQVGVFASLQDVPLGDKVIDAVSGAIEAVSGTIVPKDAPTDDSTLVVDSTLDIETAQMFYMTADHKPIPAAAQAPTLDGSLIDPSRTAPTGRAESEVSPAFSTESTVLQGVSRVDQGVVLRARLDTEMVLAQTSAQAMGPQARAGNDVDLSSNDDTIEMPFLSATSGVAPVDIESSAGKLIDPIAFHAQKSENAIVSQTDTSNQNADVAAQPSQSTAKSAELTEASLLPALSGRRDAEVSDVVLRDTAMSGPENASKQQQTFQSQVEIPISSQGLAAVQSLNAKSLNKPEALIEAGSTANRTENQDETGVAPSTSSTPVQAVAAPAPSSNPVVSKAEASGVTQQANDSPVVDHGDADVVPVDASVAESSTDTPIQSHSVPSAAERSAALYSGMADNAAIQAVADGGARMQDFEMTSLYGGTDSISAQLDQLSQTDPLTQTSRVELPARLAAQIADVAKQLPDGPIEISLSPEELGKVKLTFQVSEGGAMNVVVAAERAETLEFMRRNIDSLLAEFSDLGYEGSSFQFQQDDQSASGDQSNQSESGRSNGTIGSADTVQASQSDTNLSSPVRLHLDGSAGMDLRL
jgi:hypothetical protein